MKNRPHFYLQRLLNLQVLSHSKSFEGFDLKESLEELQRWQEKTGESIGEMIDQLKSKSLSVRWKLVFSEINSNLQVLAPSLPLSLLALYQREIAKLDPELYLNILQNFAAAELLTTLNGPDDALAESLLKGNSIAVVDWFPTSLGETETTLLAQKKGDRIQLTGRKNSMFGQFGQLDVPRVYFAYARPEGGTEECMYLVEKGDIEVKLDPLIANLGVGHVNFGHQDSCFGTFIGTLDNAGPLKQFHNTMRTQLLLLQSCLASIAYKRALDFGQNQLIKDMSDEDREVALLYHPLAGDSLLELKAFREGLTGAVLQTAFYQDCVNQSDGEGKEYFEDLLEVYLLVFKVYNSKHVPQVIQNALQLSGSTHLELLGLLEVSAVAGLAAGSELELSAQLVNQVLTRDEGRAFTNLMAEFNQVTGLLPKTDAMKEALGIFNDFVGGLFILVEDIKSADQPAQTTANLVHARRITDLFGDVMLCSLLIRQAFEAEKVLEEMGVNFYNLGQEAVTRPEARPYYNLIVLVEQFSIQHLSKQESQIRIIQKNLAPSLNALLVSEDQPEP